MVQQDDEDTSDDEAEDEGENNDDEQEEENIPHQSSHQSARIAQGVKPPERYALVTKIQTVMRKLEEKRPIRTSKVEGYQSRDTSSLCRAEGFNASHEGGYPGGCGNTSVVYLFS